MTTKQEIKRLYKKERKKEALTIRLLDLVQNIMALVLVLFNMFLTPIVNLWFVWLSSRLNLPPPLIASVHDVMTFNVLGIIAIIGTVFLKWFFHKSGEIKHVKQISKRNYN